MTPIVLTEADEETCRELTDLCLRSKALWGYDAAFMEACVGPLTVTAEDFADCVAVFRNGDRYSAYLQLSLSGDEAYIAKLFVCPDHVGKGLGSAMMTFAKQKTGAGGYTRILVESDPQAVPFYAAHGGVKIGEVPSEAIPGRMLPLLSISVGHS